MERFLNNIIQGDCLEVMPGIPDRSVDMVLCDLPYGLTQNKWDTVINMERLWEQYARITKPNAAIVLTAQGKFTGFLIHSKPEWFRYKIIWIKSKSTNFLNVSKQPLRRHEDICVFYRKQPVFNPQKTHGKPYERSLRKDNGSDSYGKMGISYSKSPDGTRFPSDVHFLEEDAPPDWVYFKAAAGRDGTYHPTQKPIDLGRWLIRSYTNPGEIVLDNTCGSGSFLVAAVLEKRAFVGIEINDHPAHFKKAVDYIASAWKRIDEARLRNTQLEL